MLSTAALAVGGCTSKVSVTQPSDTPGASNPGPPPPPGGGGPAVNQAPLWRTVPNIVFTQGVASSISIASFVTDPDGDPLTITEQGALPTGVTYDQANKRFVYDGSGPVASVSGIVLIADDGRP
jgi:hypothetical protein